MDSRGQPATKVISNEEVELVLTECKMFVFCNQPATGDRAVMSIYFS